MKSSAKYVDGFVLPVKKKKVADYKKMAKVASKVWLDCGAIDYVECIADDVKPGKVTSFPQSVKLKKDEVVIFAWAAYKSRKHRDQVMKKVMADERMKNWDMSNIPFDGKRMFWGGFKTMISVENKKAK